MFGKTCCSLPGACTLSRPLRQQKAPSNPPIPRRPLRPSCRSITSSFMVQENRSFDHYFGALRDYWAKNGYPG